MKDRFISLSINRSGVRRVNIFPNACETNNRITRIKYIYIYIF